MIRSHELVFEHFFNVPFAFQICGGSHAMSVYSTPVKIDGECVYDFPAPYRVLADRSLSGHSNMTIEYCADFCSGMEISVRYCLG